jgi:hypothetical protein
VILSVPVRRFRPRDAVRPTKSYRPAGTGRCFYAFLAVNCQATSTSPSGTEAVDLVDTMDGVDIVEQAPIPTCSLLEHRSRFEMQGRRDDDPSDLL